MHLFNSLNISISTLETLREKNNVYRIRCNCLAAQRKHDMPKQHLSGFYLEGKRNNFPFGRSLRGEILFSHMNLSFEL